jgi:catechol 2,3-dioxygenase-like lactoylglutathione lyase family enzyme
MPTGKQGDAMSDRLGIIGLQALRFGVDDLNESKRFLDEWNLTPKHVDDGAGIYATKEGATLEVRRRDDPALPPAAGGVSQLREIVWAVESADAIARIGAELAKDRAVSTDAQGTLRSVDDTGYAIAFQISALRALPPVEGRVNFPGRPVRINQTVSFTERPTVRHLGHMAMFVPNLEQAIAFYRDRLRFRPSDIYPGRGIFLRADGSHDHHNLFLVYRGDMIGFHHMSFEVADFHQVMQGGQQMQKKGWKTQFGPGRHTLGSNYFWYFHTPFGGASEYYSDMDYLDDEWELRSWEYSPEIIAAWTAHVPDEKADH